MAKIDAIKFRRKITRGSNPFPRFLYKYNNAQSIDYLKDVIVDSKFWLSSAFDFNDPFDTRINAVISGTGPEIIRRIRKGLERTGQATTNDPDREATQLYAGLRNEKIDLKQLARDSHKITMQSSGIVCFSEDPRNILLWSHYASHHKGVCFQFEIGMNPELFLYALPVIYAEKYPIFNWVKESDDKFRDGVYTKFLDWKYEKERRIVSPGRVHEYLSFHPNSLKAVIYGCKIPEQQIANVRNLLKERESKSFPKIIEYQAVQSDDAYTLKLHRN